MAAVHNPQNPSKSFNTTSGAASGGRPDGERNNKNNTNEDAKKNAAPNRSTTPGANDKPKNPGMKMPGSGDEQANRDRADPEEKTRTAGTDAEDAVKAAA